MSVLGETEINKLLIRKDFDKTKEWWLKGKFDRIGNKILIDPLKEENIHQSNYDLCVGEEYLSLRDPHKINHLKEEETFDVEPNETVLILTEEIA